MLNCFEEKEEKKEKKEKKDKKDKKAPLMHERMLVTDVFYWLVNIAHFVLEVAQRSTALTA